MVDLSFVLQSMASQTPEQSQLIRDATDKLKDIGITGPANFINSRRPTLEFLRKIQDEIAKVTTIFGVPDPAQRAANDEKAIVRDSQIAFRQSGAQRRAALPGSLTRSGFNFRKTNISFKPKMSTLGRLRLEELRTRSLLNDLTRADRVFAFQADRSAVATLFSTSAQRKTLRANRMQAATFRTIVEPINKPSSQSLLEKAKAFATPGLGSLLGPLGFLFEKFGVTGIEDANDFNIPGFGRSELEIAQQRAITERALAEARRAEAEAAADTAQAVKDLETTGNSSGESSSFSIRGGVNEFFDAIKTPALFFALGVGALLVGDKVLDKVLK